MGLDFRDSCKSGEPRTVGLQSEARYLKIFWIINVSRSTKWFFVYMIPGRKGIWKCWFLRRGENRSTRRKTSQSKGENQQQTQSTYGVDAEIRNRATLMSGECSYHWARHPCSQPLLINVEIQLVPVNLSIKITDCNSYFFRKGELLRCIYFHQSLVSSMGTGFHDASFISVFLFSCTASLLKPNLLKLMGRLTSQVSEFLCMKWLFYIHI